ncbi:YdeI/OmpD-associated family protein [Candidatus Pacearchaeota archaeon]|nr:YdeI/OmpD-associated family protein [Candidatus Pacearchaeota archaeon]
MTSQEKTFYPSTREKWRKWLEKNHLKESRIAVIRYKKHTGKPSPSHLELMHEAICFGWIDTTIKRLDEDKYLIRFTKRTDKSKWSENTLKYGKQLLKEGKMFPQGIHRYKQGLQKPTHDHGIPKNPDVPDDLRLSLKEKSLEDKFEKIAPSSKRAYLRWLYRAKLPETRKKRIKSIIKTICENKIKR